ncbi:MAG TPA: 7-cyano-7-deazaguanine synthase [Blastocatellia bacterium]|nr:7-cyano-7-deazaguanine synthase [Blastocatellia bacterium]HMV86850.1 7-cyano-7-deazaguanine synthase [Blastocatellia bacterium]HMX28292.1 7-cyano-7-deazaguanine synthase [Blastocatellia bacterium]HMZ18752.1 7-cyano-7-deazaguanine synthase [Blastocatellia bacterium]HNG30829.1 7-cyano-7-deazaguanine synthase [Blastocatellia bacterium]
MPSDFVQVHPNRYEFDFSQGNQVLAQSLVSETVALGRYFVVDLRIARAFDKRLEPLLADWMDIALFIYLADRLSPRRRRISQHHALQWGRSLYLKIPVRSPELWSSQEIYGSLRRLLYFFTEDDWQIEFVQSHKTPRPSESQNSLLPIWKPTPVRVALYSGGLDSFAGTAQQIAELPEHQFVLVSGVTNSRQGEAQRAQIRAINKAVRNPVIHIPVDYGLQQGIEREERSQRSRGFLFMTLGAITAIIAGANELFIYENGIGAINLPYDGSQVGTSSTRAVNPIALLRMAKFITDLTNIPFRIENPFLFQTKAEMCRHSEVGRLSEYIKLTFSCDGFPIRKKNKPQCGICTSCLLRQLSLESAGLSGYDSGYLHDLSSEEYFNRRKQLDSLWVMDWQAQRIVAALASVAPWQRLGQEFPALIDIVSEVCKTTRSQPKEMQSALLRLYAQYVNDWDSFSARKLLTRQALAA